MDKHDYRIPTIDASVVYKYMDAGYALNTFLPKRNRDGELVRAKGTVQHKKNTGLYNASLNHCLETSALEDAYKKECRQDMWDANNPTTDVMLSVTFNTTYREYNTFGILEGFFYKDKEEKTYLLQVKAGWIYRPDYEGNTEGFICRKEGDKEYIYPLVNGLCIAEITEEKNRPTLLAIRFLSKKKSRKDEKKSTGSTETSEQCSPEFSEEEKESLYFAKALGECHPKGEEFFFGVSGDNKYIRKELRKAKAKIKTKDLRQELYEKGIDLLLKKEEKEHYVRYKRSAGMGRNGKCFFIRERLLSRMVKWTNMSDDWGMNEGDEPSSTFKRTGLNFKKDPVKYEAYAALTLSDIEDTVKIDPRSILYVKDKSSLFEDTVNCVSTADSASCLRVNKQKVLIENKIWDGEALLDESVFATVGRKNKGMMLLRNHFFKSCAFNTKLQKWFKENEITAVSQLNGVVLDPKNTRIEDIKMVVTDSSLKILGILTTDGDPDRSKERVFRYWAKKLSPFFGIVKSEKPTHFLDGQLVRSSYQMINTIGITPEEAQKLHEPYASLKDAMRKDWRYMKWYLGGRCDEIETPEDGEEISISDIDYAPNTDEKESEEDNEAMYLGSEEDEPDKRFDLFTYRGHAVLDLLDQCPDAFAATNMYKTFRSDTIEDINKRFKMGKILFHGTYATLFGNGYELLKATINKGYNPDDDEERVLTGEQIYCKAFSRDEKLVCIRFPHITMGNVLKTQNTYSDVWEKWFNLSDQIVCVNAIKNNIQELLNGCDYDSDTMLITDNAELCNAADRDGTFLVPYKGIGEKDGNDKSMSEVDYAIANNLIGNIVNNSQELNSIYWTICNKDSLAPERKKEFDKYLKEVKEKLGNKLLSEDEVKTTLYGDICRLAVLSNTEIDKAKHSYEVTATKELSQLASIYIEPYRAAFLAPSFWKNIKKKKTTSDADKNTQKETSKKADEVSKDNQNVNSQKESEPKEELCECPMTYLHRVDIKKAPRSEENKSINTLLKLEWIGEGKETDKIGRLCLNADKLAKAIKNLGNKEGYSVINGSDQKQRHAQYQLNNLRKEISKCSDEEAVQLINIISEREKKKDPTGYEWILLAGLCYHDEETKPVISRILVEKREDDKRSEVKKKVKGFFLIEGTD